MIRMRLHILMAEKRITQKELSKITGIRQPTISAYCNDTFVMIPKEHIDILCKYFDIRIQDLIEYIPEENSKKD